MSLEENFSASVLGLRDYEHAFDVTVLEKRLLKFQGYAALDTTIQYRTGSDAPSRTWIERTIFINKGQVIFTADLKASPNRFRELEPVFNEITFHRLSLACHGTR